MATNPYQLHATPFTEADQARLVGFSCGDASWSRHVTEWILGSDVLDSMKRNTRGGYISMAAVHSAGSTSRMTGAEHCPPSAVARR